MPSRKTLVGTIIEPHTFERHRVAFVAFSRAESKTMQLASAMMMVKRIEPAQVGDPPVFAAPVFTGWKNYKEIYPGVFDDLDLVGALIAVIGGPWAGHIDWLRPTDATPIEAPTNPPKEELH